jgi:hypothetical protein
MSYVFKDRERPPPWPEFKARARHRSFVPFYFLSWVTDWAAYLLAKWPLTELLEYLGSFSILFAVIFYFADAPNRLKQKHYQAWQVINTAQGKGGNGGRIDALQELNDDHVDLIGVDVADAYLEGIRLEKAHAQRANFSSADMRRAELTRADFQDANFHFTNLRGADLAHCDLFHSRFDDADLVGARLVAANLDQVSLNGADLRGTDLANIQNWKSITGMSNANVLGVSNAPDGFVAWAKKMGATENSPN